MKPKDGLIKMALEKYPDIKLEDSFIVGDSLCDIQLGQKLGIKTFGINIEVKGRNTVKISSLKDVIRYME